MGWINVESLLFCFCITLLVSLPAVASLIPVDTGKAVSLNGKWRFKIEQALIEEHAKALALNWGAAEPVKTPEHFEPFFEPGYSEDNSWHEINVPGNWEMAGFSPATYHQPDNVSAFYRKWISVPVEWKGSRVLVNFDGVQCGAEIWLNGKPVDVSEPSWGRSNYHESGWTAWQADLTPQVRFGEKNLLALRVTKNTKSSQLDSGDYHFLGGIYRPVTLFSVPQTFIKDVTIETTLYDGNSRAQVKVIVDVGGVEDRLPAVSIRLGDFKPIRTLVDSSGNAELVQEVSNPRLWSAEHPNLYPLTAELTDPDSKLLHQVTRRVGIREVSIKDGILLVNGVPVKLTGICRHDVHPDQGTAVGEELWRKDLALMREANINAIRTSHYPYGTGFYDLCDELGFYVMDELPFCWCDTADPELVPAYEQRARETVQRDKNHPCVIIWSIGNENKPGPSLKIIADLMNELDPTRLRTVSERPADENDVDFDDTHYCRPQFIAESAANKDRRAKWPHLLTENPNTWDIRLAADAGCWDIWAAVHQRTWDVIWTADGVPGTFLWEWQDRAVRDKCSVKLNSVDPESGIQYLKIKGIVDGERNPRPWFYHLKMVHTPVKVEPEALVKQNSVVLNIENRYSFTDLSELKTNWQLLKDGETVRKGVATLALSPRSKGKIELILPKGALDEKPDALRVDFNHPGGWNVVSYQFDLVKRPAFTPPSDHMSLSKEIRFPRFNLISNVTESSPTLWRKCTRYRGSLVNVKADGVPVQDITSCLLSSVGSLEADITLENEPDTIAGCLRAAVSGNQFKYRIDWTGKKTEIQELGWIFEMPESCDRFSWDRQALWSVYPENHIGRPTGTARPDSVRVPLTVMTRPDGFDFNSTKYNCNWASLVDDKGHGIRVEFAPDQRHHCKGGFGEEGAYRLVVNKQCSPPDDISTRVVADFCLALSNGDSIEGAFFFGAPTISK